uniref:Globin n=2 Tax=Arion vulgaris TaxID=1028688 RepID=A0A0B7A8R0_9EUPU
MCSTYNFLLGDEETIMPHLTSESLCFRENAAQLIANLGKCIMAFSDSEKFTKAYADLVESHCPYLSNKQMSKTQNFQIFNQALYRMLRRIIKDIISPEVALAWRAFTFDATSSNILGVPFGSRPDTQQSATSATPSHRSNTRPATKKHSQVDQDEVDKSDQPWTSRQPNIDEIVAAVKIQKMWRGYYVRSLKTARTPDTAQNARVSEILKKCWPLIEANAEENGLFLFREMFKKDPDIMPYYPFYKDERSKISYSDYKGVFHEQRPMSWFVIFRDIFYVKEDMLIVPSVIVPINTCVLHVVDNDTGMEIPRVFQKVAPYVYKKNKKGFSFVAEARTLEYPLASGNWRLRLIGSLSSLPTPRTHEVCCNFVTKEIRDYYVPNSKNIIFRQAVKVREDLFVSLQMNTSTRGVYFKLAVLDNNEEVISAVGKGHVVIPAFTFLRNNTHDDFDTKRSGSRASNKNSPPAAPANKDKAADKKKKK